jgi:hypothetical protein
LVFLDTTVPSYVVAPRSRDSLIARRQRISRIWWARYRKRFEVVISDRVAAELSAGSAARARKREDLVENIRYLPCDPSHSTFAQELLHFRYLPAKAEADAEHIATAAFNSVRFLLTWNCKHLANPVIARKVAQLCEDRGLVCPQICTPETLMRIFRP